MRRGRQPEAPGSHRPRPNLDRSSWWWMPSTSAPTRIEPLQRIKVMGVSLGLFFHEKRYYLVSDQV